MLITTLTHATKTKDAVKTALAPKSKEMTKKQTEYKRSLEPFVHPSIKHILAYCTEKSYKLLETDLVWVGDYSLSAVNDTTLGLTWIWKGSLPDAESLPGDVALVARDAAARANVGLFAQGVTVKALTYREIPTETIKRAH